MALRRDDRPPSPSPTPIPGTPAWDAQFGRGWTVYVLSSTAVLAASFVLVIRADTPVTRVRSLALVIALFAAAFFGAVSYHLARGIGIPFGSYRGDRLIEQRVIAPATHPLGFPSLIASILALALLAIASAGWMYVRAEPVAEYLLAQERR